MTGVQVRIRGAVTRVSDSEADAYFARRPRESQLGAWASVQSFTLACIEDLTNAFAQAQQRFQSSIVPKPPWWGGYRVIANAVEFWQEKPHRLHHRELFELKAEKWASRLLYP